MIPEYLYHYTSAEGKKGIESSGCIRISPGGTRDAVFGPGVYLTHLPPDTPDEEILANNWGSPNADPSKVKYYVKIKSSDLRGVEGQRLGNRFIYKVPGSINLNDVENTVGTTGNPEDGAGWEIIAGIAAVGLGVLAVGAIGGMLYSMFSDSEEEKEKKSKQKHQYRY